MGEACANEFRPLSAIREAQRDYITHGKEEILEGRLRKWVSKEGQGLNGIIDGKGNDECFQLIPLRLLHD